jgi:uncharacterized protein (TIGR04206 family)
VTPDDSSPRRRFLAVLAAGLLPWTVLLSAGGASFVFAFGLVNTGPLGFTNAYDYFFVYTGSLPERLQAWGAGILLYAGALASATVGLRGIEDPRLTGGLLAFAGVAHARVAYGLYRTYAGTGSSAVVLPLGALAAWTVAYWYYWPLVRKRGLGPL